MWQIKKKKCITVDFEFYSFCTEALFKERERKNKKSFEEKKNKKKQNNHVYRKSKEVVGQLKRRKNVDSNHANRSIGLGLQSLRLERFIKWCCWHPIKGKFTHKQTKKKIIFIEKSIDEFSVLNMTHKIIVLIVKKFHL